MLRKMEGPRYCHAARIARRSHMDRCTIWSHSASSQLRVMTLTAFSLRCHRFRLRLTSKIHPVGTALTKRFL